MRLTDKQIHRMVKMIFKELESKNIVTYKEDKAKVFQRAIELVNEEFDEERKLDAEVNAMLDELEKQGGQEFQRFKMFPLLKRKLAAQKKVIL